MLRNKKGGAMVFVPPIEWNEEALTFRRGKGEYWRKEAVAMGHRMMAAIVQMATAFKSVSGRAPAPPWAAGREFDTVEEERLKVRLDVIERKTQALDAERAELTQQLGKAGILRGLLYESGRPLEEATIEALRVLQFHAEPFRNAESEFDAIFVSEEGRCLGEAEGKDSKAINVDKISQLQRNLSEDYERDEVTAYAKGVLFGNAYRFEAVAKRGAFFTEKCVLAAKRLEVALVRTPDLFKATQYVLASEDLSYAKECRRAIFATSGDVVSFPEPPTK